MMITLIQKIMIHYITGYNPEKDDNYVIVTYHCGTRTEHGLYHHLLPSKLFVFALRNTNIYI